MIHPVVDDVAYYKELTKLPKCVALKLHGIAGGYSPDLIDEKHIEAIRKTGLPLIIHTDYDKTSKGDLGMIRNMNSPRKWFEFVKTNRLKAYLCHGCRLDISLLRDIAHSENVLVGIGPDYAIQNDLNRLIDYPEPSYLTAMASILPKEKMAFDIDYCYMEGDDSFLHRITSSLPDSYIECVMGRNAYDFFGLKEFM